MNEAFIASGQYCKPLEVKVTEDKCFECQYKKKVLVFDCSEGEYTALRFCIDCLKDFHDGKISESTWNNDLKDF